jgi:ATP-dependent DNA helicase RecQ
MITYLQILTKYWGYSHFRPLQEDIIRSIVSGKDTLALMPTGGGKSITFQVPAMAKEGICLVITPLIALMKDQVDNLKKRDIKAIGIHSGLTYEEINIALDNCIYGDFKFLYVSPERIGTEMFRARVQKMNINLVAIDEAHCISQWGYDFRPSYLKIADLKNFLPNIPFLALTATATSEVVKDIQEKLKFKNFNVLKTSFERKNLVYVVRETEDKLNYLLNIISKIQGSGIIYARNRLKTKELASFLQKNQISADYYHAGLKDTERHLKQQAWKTGKCRVIVATNAFGMGIDKPDVRFVIHFDLPDTLEAYFQEAGRAGRDEKRAYAVLLYNPSDLIKAEQRIETNFPEIEYIKRVYHSLGNYYQIQIGEGKNLSFDFNLNDFCTNYKFNFLTAYNSLKILELDGYLQLTEEIDNPSKVHFIVERDDLYKFQVANAGLDGFIKLLLRSYTGFFSDYVSIDEQFLAKKVGIDRKTVYEYLKRLSSLKIIKYIPQKKTPLIIYTEERLDEKNLFISQDNYGKRKEKYIEKLHNVISYITSRNKCRSEMLLGYFGEKDSQRCGLCDVCQRRNELNMSKYEFDLILEKLKNFLTIEETSLEDLVKKTAMPQDKTLKVIQWLLDNEKIVHSENQKLTWNKPSN